LINRRLWAWVDAGIAVSNAVRRALLDGDGVSASRIETIHHGLEPEAPAPDPDALRRDLGIAPEETLVGMAGRLLESKGMRQGLEAVARIRGSHPRCRLVIAGDGPLRETLRTGAKDLGLGSSTHFLGWREDVPQIMAALDVFLMPSLREGFGIVLLEAMAAGVPVVASAAGAAREVVRNGETGFVVEPGDVGGLASGLDRLLGDADLRRRMGRMARARVESEFTAARMVERTYWLYQRLLGEMAGNGEGSGP
jgi:glycosyltransferase involved in cell wall biosynthesis